jgi:hypothetical protein
VALKNSSQPRKGRSSECTAWKFRSKNHECPVSGFRNKRNHARGSIRRQPPWRVPLSRRDKKSTAKGRFFQPRGRKRQGSLSSSSALCIYIYYLFCAPAHLILREKKRIHRLCLPLAFHAQQSDGKRPLEIWKIMLNSGVFSVVWLQQGEVKNSYNNGLVVRGVCDARKHPSRNVFIFIMSRVFHSCQLK